MIAKCKIRLDNEFMSEITEGEAVGIGLTWRELYLDIDLDKVTIEEMDYMSNKLGDRFEVMGYEQ